jgi:hypothetical protein
MHVQVSTTNVPNSRKEGAVRKFFYGLGVTTAIAIVAAAIGFFILARSGTALDTASKAFVSDTVIAVTSRWDADELWKRASPHFKTSVRREDLRTLFYASRDALGPLMDYRGSDGQAMMSSINLQTNVSAQYVAHAGFEKGDADLWLSLIKQGDTWMVEGFHELFVLKPETVT